MSVLPEWAFIARRVECLIAGRKIESTSLTNIVHATRQVAKNEPWRMKKEMMQLERSVEAFKMYTVRREQQTVLSGGAYPDRRSSAVYQNSALVKVRAIRHNPRMWLCAASGCVVVPETKRFLQL
jgi:hypothetical protein